MSSNDYKTDRVDRNRARKLVSEIMANHPAGVNFSRHALSEAAKDDLTTVDLVNILKSPDSKIHTDGEFENGSFRYRLETSNIMVVISFWPTGKGLNVVTTWDKRKKKG